MDDLGALARLLSEAADPDSAAGRLVEHLAPALGEDSAARVYLLGPGDRCSVCARQERCAARDRCFHLAAGHGRFLNPLLVDLRVPRLGTAWGDLLPPGRRESGERVPEELCPPDDVPEHETLLLPLEAGGEIVGALGVRAPAGTLAGLEGPLRVACFLTATAIRLLRSLSTATRRFEQLLLVNDLGRKVNSILNDELLLRQAAMDIHRSFGFHNVMIFMVDSTRSHLELKAQASRYASPSRLAARVKFDEGVVGRVYRTGRAEVVEDVTRDDAYLSLYADTRSELAVPIQIGGVVEGVLNVESDRVSAFTPAERLVLETVANQLAIAIENARLFGMVKEREDRYRALVESSPGAVLHLDAEGNIIYANPAALAMTGREKADLLSERGGLAALAAPGEERFVEAAVRAALRGIPRKDLEFHLSHADGSLRVLHAALQPLVGEQGDPRGVVVLARDKTRERELQEKLTQSEKLTAMGTLVSGVAHELNNPLAGILGFAQLLRARPPEEWSHKDLEHIEQSARRCQRIVENLLAFGRQSRMTKRHANLNHVIESVINLHEYPLRMDDIRVERDFDPDLPAFPIDVNRWQQVFVNLMTNAQQALITSRERERVIRFETQRVGDQVVIRVADTGPGVPLRDRKHIFDPFFTTKESGTGLGLGICYGIVNEHGGTIELEDDVEVGASFRIVLPITDPEEIRVEIPTPSESEGSRVSGAGRRVLVVDDDPLVCDVVSRTLANYDYTVRVVHTGEEALRKASEERMDVVLTDVRMPGELDGIDLYNRLVGEDPTFASRVVFMTGNILDTRTMERLDNLSVRCLQKPFDIHALASLVNEVAGVRAEEAGSGAPRVGNGSTSA